MPRFHLFARFDDGSGDWREFASRPAADAAAAPLRARPDTQAVLIREYASTRRGDTVGVVMDARRSRNLPAGDKPALPISCPRCKGVDGLTVEDQPAGAYFAAEPNYDPIAEGACSLCGFHGALSLFYPDSDYHRFGCPDAPDEHGADTRPGPAAPAAPVDPRATDGPYRPELAKAFRDGARAICRRLDLARFTVPDDAYLYPADGGTIVRVECYVSDGERPLMPGEDAGETMPVPGPVPGILGALGFEYEMGGGGSIFASRYFDNGQHVWVTWNNPAPLPTDADFTVCAYSEADDGWSPLFDVRGGEEGNRPPQPGDMAHAVAAAITFCGVFLTPAEIAALRAAPSGFTA